MNFSKINIFFRQIVSLITKFLLSRPYWFRQKILNRIVRWHRRFVWVPIPDKPDFDNRGLWYSFPNLYRLRIIAEQHLDPFFDPAREEDFDGDGKYQKVFEHSFAFYWDNRARLLWLVDRFIYCLIYCINKLFPKLVLTFMHTVRGLAHPLGIIFRCGCLLVFWLIVLWFFWQWRYWLLSILPNESNYDFIRDATLIPFILFVIGFFSPFSSQSDPFVTLFESVWTWGRYNILDGGFFCSRFFNSSSDLFGFELSSGFFPEFVWIWFPSFSHYLSSYMFYPTMSALGAPVAIPVCLYLFDAVLFREAIVYNMRYIYFKEGEGMYEIPEMYDEETEEATPATFGDYYDYFMGFALVGGIMAGFQVDLFWEILNTLPKQSYTLSVINQAWDVPVDVKDLSRLRLKNYRNLYEKYSFTILTQIQHQVFLQTYLDVLQIRYGSSVGHYFYQTPNSTLSAEPFYYYKDVTQTLQNLEIEVLDSYSQILQAAKDEMSRVCSISSFTLQDYGGGEITSGTITTWAIPDFLFYCEALDYIDDFEWSTDITRADLGPDVYGSYKKGNLDIDDMFPMDEEDPDDFLNRSPYKNKIFGTEKLAKIKRFEKVYELMLQGTPWTPEQKMIVASFMGDDYKQMSTNGKPANFEDLGPVRPSIFYFTDNFFDPDDGDTNYMYQSSWPELSVYDYFFYAYKPYLAADLDFLEDLFFGNFSLDYFLILQQYLRPRIDTGTDFLAAELSEDWEGVDYLSRRNSWVYKDFTPYGPADYMEMDADRDRGLYPLNVEVQPDNTLNRLIAVHDPDFVFTYDYDPDFVSNDLNWGNTHFDGSNLDFIWTPREEGWIRSGPNSTKIRKILQSAIDKRAEKSFYTIGLPVKPGWLLTSPVDSKVPELFRKTCSMVRGSKNWSIYGIPNLQAKSYPLLKPSFFLNARSGVYSSMFKNYDLAVRDRSWYMTFSWTHSKLLYKQLLFGLNHNRLFGLAATPDNGMIHRFELYHKLTKNSVPYTSDVGYLMLDELVDSTMDIELEDPNYAADGPWDETYEFSSHSGADISTNSRTHSTIVRGQDFLGDFYQEEPRDLYYGNFFKKVFSWLTLTPYYPLDDNHIAGASIDATIPHSRVWPFLRRLRHPHPLSVQYKFVLNIDDERQLVAQDLVKTNTWLQGIIWDVPDQVQVGALHYAWPFSFDNNGLVPVEWFYSRLTRNDFALNYSLFEWWAPSLRFKQLDDVGGPNWHINDIELRFHTYDPIINRHMNKTYFTPTGEKKPADLRTAEWMSNEWNFYFSAIQQLLVYRLSSFYNVSALPKYIDILAFSYIPNWRPVTTGPYYIYNEVPNKAGLLENYFLNFYEANSVETREYNFHLIRYINGYPHGNKMRGFYYGDEPSFYMYNLEPVEFTTFNYRLNLKV